MNNKSNIAAILLAFLLLIPSVGLARESCLDTFNFGWNEATLAFENALAACPGTPWWGGGPPNQLCAANAESQFADTQDFLITKYSVCCAKFGTC